MEKLRKVKLQCNMPVTGLKSVVKFSNKEFLDKLKNYFGFFFCLNITSVSFHCYTSLKNLFEY